MFNVSVIALRELNKMRKSVRATDNRRISYGLLTSETERQMMGRLRYQVYCLEQRYIPDGDLSDEIEFDEHDQHSILLGAFCDITDESKEMVGCMRLIIGLESKAVPCEDFFELTKRAPNGSKSCEISRLIVIGKARKRSKEIILGLTREAYRCCVELGISHCYAVVEQPLFMFLKQLGLPFEIVGVERWYYSSLNVPCLLTVCDVEASQVFEAHWREMSLAERTAVRLVWKAIYNGGN